MFGPLHQGVELLLPGELELGLLVGLLGGLVQVELVAHSLGLQDPLGGHFTRPDIVLSLVLGLLAALACDKIIVKNSFLSGDDLPR